MKKIKLDILAFGSHPDDVELSCSGTILKNVSKGLKVGIIDLTRGELGTRGTPVLRAKEALAAARILGVEFRENLGLEDGFFRLDKPSLINVIRKIRQYRPEVVLANAMEDRHPDHGRGAALVAEACFLAGLPKIKTRSHGLLQPAWRPKALYHYIQYRKLKPDFVVDISGFMEKKIESIMAFSSQFYNPGSKEPETLISQKNFMDYIRTREKEYGRLIGKEYGEGFNVKEEYKGEIKV